MHAILTVQYFPTSFTNVKNFIYDLRKGSNFYFENIIVYTERKSTEKIQVKTLIFIVFDDNGGIFACKVKFTVSQ